MALLLTIGLAGCGSSGPRSAPATTVTTTRRSVATSFAGLPQVGALFAGSSDQGLHFCTASVVHSSAGDVIATAAHCLSGTGVGLTFAPGYHDGVAPHGLWSVTAAYVDPRWLRSHDPTVDVAFLTVAPQTRDGRKVEVEHAVGADRLAVDQSLTTAVTVVAYPGQVGGRPLRCATTTYAHLGYAAFDCGGYVDGTSGGPWLMRFDPATGRGRLYGVIGGLNQGGCKPDTSYSAHFDAGTARLLARAAKGGPGDTVPPAGSDGC